MKITRDILYEIMKLLDKNTTVKEISECTGVSKTSVYKLKNDYPEPSKIIDILQEYYIEEISIEEKIKTIKSLARSYKWKEAIELCLENIDNSQIKSELVNIYIKSKNFKRAEELCIENIDYIKSKSQLITIYTYTNRIKEAEELCLEEVDNIFIVSQLINIYIKQRKYKKAEKLCLENMKNTYIISQLIKIYLKQNRLVEAKKICLDNLDDVKIISQLVAIYIRYNDLEKAELLCIENIENIMFQSQLLTIYIKKQRLEDIEKLCSKKILDETMITQLSIFYKSINDSEKIEKIKKIQAVKNKNTLAHQLIQNIFNNNFTWEEIIKSFSLLDNNEQLIIYTLLIKKELLIDNMFLNNLKDYKDKLINNECNLELINKLINILKYHKKKVHYGDFMELYSLSISKNSELSFQRFKKMQ